MERIQSAAVTLACALGLCSCETYPHDKATALVTAPYPGRNEIGGCKPYADALCKTLAAHHIPAWRVDYLRNNMSGPYGHSMVVYKDAGAYWCADNAFPYPTRCQGTTPLEWAREREASWLADGENVYPGAVSPGPNTITGAGAVRGGTILALKSHRANHPATVAARATHRHHKQDAGITGEIRKAGKKTDYARYANRSGTAHGGQ